LRLVRNIELVMAFKGFTLRDGTFSVRFVYNYEVSEYLWSEQQDLFP
jgi:hypothetical protein